MSNLTTINGFGALTPSAYVVRTKEKNRGRLKIYDDKNIYLSDKEVFEIELFNPTEKKVLAKIEINGKFISNNGLVLKPGQRVFLERFIDENKKFVFETYEVDNYESVLKDVNVSEALKELKLRKDLSLLTSPSCEDLERIEFLERIEEASIVKNSIKDNGVLSISFYDEYSNYIYNGYGNSTITYTKLNTNIGSSYTTLGGIGSASANYTCNLANISNTTGRIEGGEKSNQDFKNDNSSFHYFASHIITYKLLPIDSKPMESEDLKQYCSNCGKKLHPKDNYCSKCGTKA